MSLRRRLAGWAPTLALAGGNLTRARARSALAILAVVIGVVAIGAIGTGGEAFKQDQLAAYEGFGGTATVDPIASRGSQAPSTRVFSESEFARLRRAAGGASVFPVIEPAGTLVRGPRGDPIVPAQVQAIGTPGAFYDAQAGTIPDNWRRSVILGSRVANTNGIGPGDRVTVAVAGRFERDFRVAAVLEPQGFADPLNADQSVFLPLGTFETPEYDTAVVQVDPRTGDIEATARRIERAFDDRGQPVRVELVQDQREQFREFFGTVNQFLIGVGAISLVVAAVTIANTMLMSVIEREGEIGVLRAVGYPKTAVISVLLAEATVLGAVGAAIGAPIALGIGAIANALLVGDPLAFTPTGLAYVGVGVGFGVLTALLAGLYPAWKAANKPPVEAFDT